MGKIGRITRTTLRKDFVVGFIGTFLAVLGVPSTIISLLGGHFSASITSSLVLFALSVSVIVNRRKWRTPWAGILPGKNTLRCPCDRTLTRKVASLARYEFGRDTISLSDYEPLRGRNRLILTCLIGAKGDFLGYFDVIPLKKSFAELFLQGRVGEKDLTPENIFSDREIRRCKYVYIAGMAACEADSPAGQTNAAILIWGLLKHLDHFYGRTNAYAFASAVSEDGQNLLESFKIPLVSEADTRSDNHKLYGVYLSRERLNDWLACVPDYSLLCSLDWATTKSSKTDARQVPRRPTSPQQKRSSLSA